ncbi:hypothetical protein MRX96_007598 [Rhipicephalus microplus]
MDMDDAEEAGVEPTVLEEPPVRATTSCAAHDTVGDHSEMFSSGCSSNMINTECDAVSVPTARVTTINDFVLKIKKTAVLTFFRVAEVHKLPHSTAESVFNDFKITFLDIIRTFASVIENNIAMESAGIELRKLLAGEFLEDIFQAASSKYKREQFAKRHLPYVKPEVRDLGAGGASSARKQSGPLEQLAGWRSAKPRCRSTNNIRVAASSRTVEAASLVAAAQRAISWPVCAAGHAVCFGRVLISTESTLNRKFLAAPIFFCVTAHLRNCGGSSIWVPFGRMYLAAHQREQQLSLTCGRDCRPLLEERRQLGAAAACVSA